MNLLDLTKDKIYTDDKGHYRMIIAFYDGWDGDRRVQYEKGNFNNQGEWIRVGEAMNCKKKSFARWSRSIVKIKVAA